MKEKGLWFPTDAWEEHFPIAKHAKLSDRNEGVSEPELEPTVIYDRFDRPILPEADPATEQAE